MAHNFGTVNFKGKTYTLMQSAYVENYRGGVAYFAAAKDADGNDYTVRWNTTPEWDEAQAEAERIAKQYEPSTAPSYEYPALLDDESNACDWDNPADVCRY